MSKRMEGKQRTPSVIARLMGLDEMAPQQPLHRQQKVLSDDYLRKTASIGLLEKRSPRDVRVSKVSVQKQDKYLCGSEISNIDKQIIRSVSDESSNPSMVRADFSFTRQRNSHAKYLSKDEKLFDLKGFDGVLGDQHANSKQRYYHPDLSAKQFGGHKGLQPQLHSGQLPASMSISISDDSEGEVCEKLDKMITQRIALRSPQKLDRNFGQTYINPLDKLKPQLDLKDRSTYFSRRIVVLRPNSRQVQNSADNLLMPKSSVLSLSDSDSMDHVEEILKPENGELNIEGPERADATSVMEPPRHSFGVMRGSPKRTQVVKKNSGSSFGGFPKSTVKAGKSPPTASEEISCQSSFDRKGRERISYPFPSGSLFAMEAKKQIFERWKSTKSFQEIEVDGGRCTLGEMFVMHNGGVRPKTSNVKISQFCNEGKKLDLGSPQCVGNKYGLKDKDIENLSRLELFKMSSTATDNSNLRTISGASQNGFCPGRQDVATEDSNNFKNKASRKNESRSGRVKKKYNADNAALKVNHNISQSADQDYLDFDWDKRVINGEAEHRPITASNLSTKGLACVNSLSHSKAEAVFSSEDQLLEIDHSILPVGDGHTHASSDVWENLIPQRSSFDSPSRQLGSSCTTDPNLAVNLKEINHNSPNSVLEPHFKEENPFASEFYNGPLADLSGLVMKLELLNSKLEETNSESSAMNVSSDEDNEKGSTDVTRRDKKLWRKSRPEESRDFSYLVDVLDEANFYDGNMDNLYETWLSMEFPVNPSLFEALEKKYGRQTSWLKSDRRLLFDRINSGLKEILASFMDIRISTKPLRRRYCSTLRRDEIEEELWMLLLNQEKEVSKALSEKALGMEMKWLELEEDISIICREIEENLFNELEAELD